LEFFVSATEISRLGENDSVDQTLGVGQGARNEQAVISHAVQVAADDGDLVFNFPPLLSSQKGPDSFFASVFGKVRAFSYS
jgi:hypothetical protein